MPEKHLNFILIVSVTHSLVLKIIAAEYTKKHVTKRYFLIPT
jgi:hypothetical protein